MSQPKGTTGAGLPNFARTDPMSHLGGGAVSKGLSSILTRGMKFVAGELTKKHEHEQKLIAEAERVMHNRKIEQKEIDAEKERTEREEKYERAKAKREADALNAQRVSAWQKHAADIERKNITADQADYETWQRDVTLSINPAVIEEYSESMDELLKNDDFLNSDNPMAYFSNFVAEKIAEVDQEINDPFSSTNLVHDASGVAEVDEKYRGFLYAPNFERSGESETINKARQHRQKWGLKQYREKLQNSFLSASTINKIKDIHIKKQVERNAKSIKDAIQATQKDPDFDGFYKDDATPDSLPTQTPSYLASVALLELLKDTTKFDARPDVIGNGVKNIVFPQWLGQRNIGSERAFNKALLIMRPNGDKPTAQSILAAMDVLDAEMAQQDEAFDDLLESASQIDPKYGLDKNEIMDGKPQPTLKMMDEKARLDQQAQWVKFVAGQKHRYVFTGDTPTKPNNILRHMIKQEEELTGTSRLWDYLSNHVFKGNYQGLLNLMDKTDHWREEDPDNLALTRFDTQRLSNAAVTNYLDEISPNESWDHFSVMPVEASSDLIQKKTEQIASWLADHEAEIKRMKEIKDGGRTENNEDIDFQKAHNAVMQFTESLAGVSNVGVTEFNVVGPDVVGGTGASIQVATNITDDPQEKTITATQEQAVIEAHPQSWEKNELEKALLEKALSETKD